MRFETHKASSYLVHHLKYADPVKAVREDGGDIILLDLVDGKTAAVYLFEQAVKLPELVEILADNAAQQRYTLFIFWCDMLLPADGRDFLVDDWMAALLRLYGGKLYGYEVAGSLAYFFPVYFEGTGTKRAVRYGDTVLFKNFRGFTIDQDSDGLKGKWYLADFEEAQGEFFSSDFSHWRASSDTALAKHLLILGLDESADFESAKQAYRALARLYHPDRNPSDSAGYRMQQINAAYEAVMKHFLDTK